MVADYQSGEHQGGIISVVANLCRERTQDGTRLATLADVRAFILNEPKHIQERGSWQHAAELMILAAERGGSIEAATTQIEDTLFLEARL